MLSSSTFSKLTVFLTPTADTATSTSFSTFSTSFTTFLSSIISDPSTTTFPLPFPLPFSLPLIVDKINAIRTRTNLRINSKQNKNANQPTMRPAILKKKKRWKVKRKKVKTKMKKSTEKVYDYFCEILELVIFLVQVNEILLWYVVETVVYVWQLVTIKHIRTFLDFYCKIFCIHCIGLYFNIQLKLMFMYDN